MLDNVKHQLKRHYKCMSDSYLSEEELAALDAEVEAVENTTAEAVQEAVLRRAAAMAAAGATKVAMRKELKLSERQLDRVYKSDRFKQLVTDIADDAVAASKNKTRLAIARMGEKAMKALEANLDKGSLEAVKVFLRAIGLEQAGDENKDAGGFTLVLANQKPEPKTVQVVREDKE